MMVKYFRKGSKQSFNDKDQIFYQTIWDGMGWNRDLILLGSFLFQ